MTSQKKIQVGGTYSVKYVEDDPEAFLGAEIRVYWTDTSFAQMTLEGVSEDDYGCTNFIPSGASEDGSAIVDSDMLVEVIAINDKDMPTVPGSVVSFCNGNKNRIFFVMRVPESPVDTVFMETPVSRPIHWIEIKERAAGSQIYVSEPSWKKVGE